MIMEVGLLKRFNSSQSQGSGLEGTEPGSDDDRTAAETSAGFGTKLKGAVALYGQIGNTLSEVVGGVERLELFRQPVDQFLGADNRQGRDVIDCFVRVQHGALTADDGQ